MTTLSIISYTVAALIVALGGLALLNRLWYAVAGPLDVKRHPIQGRTMVVNAGTWEVSFTNDVRVKTIPPEQDKISTPESLNVRTIESHD